MARTELSKLSLYTILKLHKNGDVTMEEAIEALEEKAGFCVEVKTCEISKLSKKQE